MNKKNIKLIIFIIGAIIFSGAVFYGGFYYSNWRLNRDLNKVIIPKNLMNEEEKLNLKLYDRGNYEVISRDASGTITEYKFMGLREPKPINLELMSDAEKADRGLDLTLKIQVLSRDSQGKILSYKLIKNDADILSAY